VVATYCSGGEIATYFSGRELAIDWTVEQTIYSSKGSTEESGGVDAMNQVIIAIILLFMNLLFLPKEISSPPLFKSIFGILVKFRIFFKIYFIHSFSLVLLSLWLVNCRVFTKDLIFISSP